MADHDTTLIEDGFVVCRCKSTFSDNSTEEAMVRWRFHVKQVEGLAAVAEAREALNAGLIGEALTSSSPESPLPPEGTTHA